MRLQSKLNFQPHGVSAVSMRMLTGKEWDAERWNGGVWEDPDEAGDIEPQHSGETSLSEEEVSPPHL